MSRYVGNFRGWIKDFNLFCQLGNRQLRLYQTQAANAVIDSVVKDRGLSLVVMFPRQSGKNELQAQIEAYLMLLYSSRDVEIVKISPTWKPQSLNAMRRLERVLQGNPATRRHWQKESGYIYRIGRARAFFLSGEPEANIVGATASLLLQVDEAQSVQTAKYDTEIAPMAASTNATRALWGTAWTNQTLLAREMRDAQRAYKEDGIQRVYRITADQVAAELPAYGHYVARQVARLGRNHPSVRTQYFSEELEACGGMFPAERIKLMQGSHPRLSAPRPGGVYALLLDVAGEDESAGDPLTALENPGRDSTALTVVEVDSTAHPDLLGRKPVYRVVERLLWTGVRHTALYARLIALFEHWRARWLVVDATGVGAGLASFLEQALPGRVIPFVFNAATKSKLGWDFINLVEEGRFKDYAEDTQGADSPGALFQRQVEACQSSLDAGPGGRMRWGVPEGARDPLNGERLHDDLLLSAALCSLLDGKALGQPGPALVVPRRDPLAEMDGGNRGEWVF